MVITSSIVVSASVSLAGVQNSQTDRVCYIAASNSIQIKLAAQYHGAVQTGHVSDLLTDWS